jgi:hypothetical protein
MREAILRAGARTYYDLMSDIERTDVDRRLHWIEHNPEPDNVTTIAAPELPQFVVFDDRVWQIVYEVPDAATLLIHAIAHALDLHRDS